MRMAFCDKTWLVLGGSMHTFRWQQVFRLSTLVAGLGYFVDMFDLTLFGVLRVQSLAALGVTNQEQVGLFLYEMQMLGMMLGGLLWGVMADKRGRLSVLFGSILLYSLGNIANAFVTNETQYAICRFVTGVGLAGELGAAITLVSEQLPKEVRGVGTTLVATLGMSGCIAAVVICQMVSWRTAYLIGGGMGLVLLAARFRMFESSMFEQTRGASIRRGSLALLLAPRRLMKYLSCILIGVPIYFITGILMTFAPEMARGLGIAEPVSAGNALLYGTIGLTVGDLLSGLTSQLLRRRKITIVICLAGALQATVAYLYGTGLGAQEIYILCLMLGLFSGYWAVLVTMAAEQFGTNLRATVATSVPNFVRGSAALITLIFATLRDSMSAQSAALAVGLGCFVLAFVALASLDETFGKDLDFVEHD